MKKAIKTILLLISILLPISVSAATGSYTISSSSSVEVGSNISVTFKISATKMFYWQSYITYDTSRLQLVSGSTTFQGESESLSGQSSVTKTLKFKGKKAGSAWVTIAMGDKGNNINSSSQEISFSKKTKTITVKNKTVKQETTKKQETNKKTYSSNNNLKSLSVDGYKLSPTFSKNTLEYKVELPENTTKIKVNATKEDSNAILSGTGIKNVSEGMNKIKIKVTAENGNIKEYIIKATVKEEKPIEVNINNEKYTIIRKYEQLPKANSSFEQIKIKINNSEIPALKSEITNYVLIGLKNNTTGEKTLYIYNKESNTYTLYNEIKTSIITIIPIEDENISIPNNYKETEITIYEKKIKAYILNNSLPIFKGQNIETGEKSLYSYDEKENTIQRYMVPDNFNQNRIKLNDSILSIGNNKTYLFLIIGLGSLLVITYIAIMANIIKKKNKKKRIKLENEKKQKQIEEQNKKNNLDEKTKK